MPDDTQWAAAMAEVLFGAPAVEALSETEPLEAHLVSYGRLPWPTLSMSIDEIRERYGTDQRENGGPAGLCDHHLEELRSTICGEPG